MKIEQRKGALFGLAWGDALGCPVESWRDYEIEKVYGTYDGLPEAYPLAKIPPKRRRRLRPLGLHSDDTQQALALVLLLLTGGWDRERWKQMLVRGWQDGAWRGIGRNFVSAVHRLRKGASIKESGSPSAGIGAAMRTGPIAAVYFRETDQEKRLTAVLESTLMTHCDQRAAVFASVVTEAVALFIQGSTPDQVWEQLPAFASLAEEKVQKMAEEGWKIEEANSRIVSQALSRAIHWRKEPVQKVRTYISELARPYLKEGFTRAHPNQGFVLLGGLHALLMACREDLEPNEILLSIIREGFDTDTVAAIAGSILGARFGLGWIPAEKLLDQARLERYCDAIVNQTVPETEDQFFQWEAKWTAEEKKFQLSLIF